MIIWIASYPKSGNTWLRFLISNYIFKKNNFISKKKSILEYIDQFPTREKLDFYINKHSQYNFKDPMIVGKHWMEIQKLFLYLNYKLFFKTHNCYFDRFGNKFCNSLTTKAAVYIIRDPRDVVCSYMDWMKEEENKILDFILKSNYTMFPSKDHFVPFTYIGNWEENIKSWELSFAEIKLKIIRYEDLYNNTHDIFKEILLFLSEFIDIKIDPRKIDEVIEDSKLDKLKILEKDGNFIENTGKNIFFNKGGTRFRSQLSDNLISKINSEFESTMKKYNYL